MRIMIADGAPKVRSALRLYIEQTRPGWEPRGAGDRAPELTLVEAGSVAAVAARLAEGRVDLALVDWALPTRGGAAAVQLVRQARPAARIIVLSGRPEAEQEALAAGADAFVSKGSPPEVLGALLASLAARPSPGAAGHHRMPRLPTSGLVASVI